MPSKHVYDDKILWVWIRFNYVIEERPCLDTTPTHYPILLCLVVAPLHLVVKYLLRSPVTTRHSTLRLVRHDCDDDVGPPLCRRHLTYYTGNTYIHLTSSDWSFCCPYFTISITVHVHKTQQLIGCGSSDVIDLKDKLIYVDAETCPHLSCQWRITEPLLEMMHHLRM